ncbi:MAG: hypothetical protein LRZ84_14690 [Desertifilum sp.]|nr:hypothetical protein [Desertifilum sp.]
MKNKYIIYHQTKPGKDCHDGIASAWVAHLAYPEAQLLGWTYQQNQQGEFPQLSSGDVAIVVDFSFPTSLLSDWEKHGIRAYIIDHHISAQEQLDQFRIDNFEEFINQGIMGMLPPISAVFDMKECGATLTWKVLHPAQPMPYFLEFVKDRDLWDFLLNETPAVHEALSTLRSNSRGTFSASTMHWLNSTEKNC